VKHVDFRFDPDRGLWMWTASDADGWLASGCGATMSLCLANMKEMLPEWAGVI
jgi:hypothetical protein